MSGSICDRPLGIDLFAGAGGLSLGFEQAGFDIAAAVELDPIHASTHRYNFPSCAVIARSVIGLTGAEILGAAGIGDRGADVVFGGAPCQGFSLIGQRALDDPRNALVREFVRLVAELRASYFVFENVKGLTVGKHKRFLDEVIEAFHAVGYQMLLPWRVLNASAYGVPQDRQRLVLIGAREGLSLPTYPGAFTAAAGSDAGALPEGPSCRDALEDLPEAEDYPELLERDWVAGPAWGDPSSYARQLRCLDGEGLFLGYARVWDRDLLTASKRARHSAISRRRFGDTAPGTVEPISRFYRLPAAGVSNTLRAGTDSARGAFTSPRPIHYARPRCVTVREMARLHGFPDWFRFHETIWHGARQVGNAVPPPLARAVAVQIATALRAQPRQPSVEVELGAADALSLDMARASRLFGIAVPIGRRDRKSGATKRKQQAIEAERLLRLREAAGG